MSQRKIVCFLSPKTSQINFFSLSFTSTLSTCQPPQPIFFPKFQILFADFPNSTFSSIGQRLRILGSCCGYQYGLSVQWFLLFENSKPKLRFPKPFTTFSPTVFKVNEKTTLRKCQYNIFFSRDQATIRRMILFRTAFFFFFWVCQTFSGISSPEVLPKRLWKKHPHGYFPPLLKNWANQYSFFFVFWIQTFFFAKETFYHPPTKKILLYPNRKSQVRSTIFYVVKPPFSPILISSL